MTDRKENLIAQVTSIALGKLALWEKPVVGVSLGPAFPELADRFDHQIFLLFGELRRHLEQFSVESLTQEFLLKKDGRFRLADPHGLSFGIAKKIAGLHAKQPAWFISGWHVRASELNVGYWRAFSSCSLAALSLLSVGLDPRKVTYDALFGYYGYSEEQDAMLYFFEDRYEAIANGLGLDPDSQGLNVDFGEFFSWTNNVGFSLDIRFRRMLKEKYKNSVAVPNSQHRVKAEDSSSNKMHFSRYKYHAKLLYAVAVEKFGLDDPRKISTAAKSIQHCAELRGQPASLAPIRHLLETGHRLCKEEE